jgi:type IV fimbrial biogenesis protein FimT
MQAAAQNARMPNTKPVATSKIRNCVAGFTMVELLVTFSVLAILATLAAPSFMQTIASNRLTAATNDLYASLVQARSDAVRQGRRVTVCVSSNGSSCNAGTVTWSVGWISFADTVRATDPSVDAGETVSYVVQASHDSLVTRGSSQVSNYVSFAPDGQAKLINGGIQTGVIRVCSTSTALSDNARAREIVLAAGGRMVIQRPSSGVAATCLAP